MCQTMLSLDPSQRGSFSSFLNSPDFPDFFPAIHEFFASLQQVMLFTAPSLPQASGASTSTSLSTQAAGRLLDTAPRLDPILHTSADEVIERLTADWSGVVHFLGPNAPQLSSDSHSLNDSLSSDSAFPLRLAIPGYEVTLPSLGNSSSPQTDGT